MAQSATHIINVGRKEAMCDAHCPFHPRWVGKGNVHRTLHLCDANQQSASHNGHGAMYIALPSPAWMAGARCDAHVHGGIRRVLCVARCLWCDAHSLFFDVLVEIRASHHIHSATQIAKIFVEFSHTTQIIVRSSVSRLVPLDQISTQVGVQGPMLIDLFLLLERQPHNKRERNREQGIYHSRSIT